MNEYSVYSHLSSRLERLNILLFIFISPGYMTERIFIN